MLKKTLTAGVLSAALLLFLFSNPAAAARVNLTLGWHNLLMDDFYLIAEDGTNFSVGDKVRGGKMKGSRLSSVATSTDIDLTDLGLSHDNHNVWSVGLSKKANKWINKKTKKSLKKAAKKEQKDATGRTRGWKTLYREYKGEDLWHLYNENSFVAAAFDKLQGKKLKGKVGGQKFVASLNIFENPFGGEGASQWGPGPPMGPDSQGGPGSPMGIGPPVGAGSQWGAGPPVGPGLQAGSGSPMGIGPPVGPESQWGPGGDSPSPAPVPEPATMVLFGLGLLGLAGVSRRFN